VAIGRARRPGVVVLWSVLIASFQRQRVDLPSGVRYWSVVDERFELVAMFDGFLFEERVSRDRSEKTSGQYASNLVEFAGWARERDLLGDLVACARNLGMFQLHLRTSAISRRGRGHGRAPSNDRVSDIMSSVRGFYRHQVRLGAVPGSVNRLLYDVVEPAGGSMPWLEDLPPLVARPLHRLPRSGFSEPQAASLEEYVAMMSAAGRLRDKLLITVLALTGLRIGQVLGLRRSECT
jgi:integrase/recombinase XerD